jgi:hypothetical protein
MLFATMSATTRRFRVSIASSMDVKGRAHWMRVGVWERLGPISDPAALSII